MIYFNLLLVVSFVFIAIVKSQEVEILVNTLDDGDSFIERANILYEYYDDTLPYHDQLSKSQKVDMKCYYECMCPYSRDIYVREIATIVEKLSKYVTLQNYPYGNAETITDKDGKVEFQCQHGPAECYGNKLHACALDILSNATQAVLYNTCMMDDEQSDRGSDDAAADKCGKSMSVNSEPIKDCAKSDKGIQLLKKYGEETKKQNINYVPWVLLNGKLYQGQELFKDLCAIINDPPECNQA